MEPYREVTGHPWWLQQTGAGSPGRRPLSLPTLSQLAAGGRVRQLGAQRSMDPCRTLLPIRAFLRKPCIPTPPRQGQPATWPPTSLASPRFLRGVISVIVVKYTKHKIYHFDHF